MKHIYLIIIGTILLAACSKEKQLEKTITKKDGKWNITSVDWVLEDIFIKNDSLSEQFNIGTATNAGSFTFEDDGSGSYDFTVFNTVFSGIFSWVANDEGNVFLTHVEQTIGPNTTTQYLVSYTALKVSKNEMEMAGSITQSSTNSQTTDMQAIKIAGEFKLTR